MKIAISYFYQIRNFRKNMIPMSTCLSDPSWFHNNEGKQRIFYDSRGILNGIRLERLIVQGWDNGCPCEDKNPTKCEFLKTYKEKLNEINFDILYKDMKLFADTYAQENKLDEEPILVLIVYEKPNEKCSERWALMEYFNKYGIECKELDYPIQPLEIKKGDFSF